MEAVKNERAVFTNRFVAVKLICGAQCQDELALAPSDAIETAVADGKTDGGDPAKNADHGNGEDGKDDDGAKNEVAPKVADVLNDKGTGGGAVIAAGVGDSVQAELQEAAQRTSQEATATSMALTQANRDSLFETASAVSAYVKAGGDTSAALKKYMDEKGLTLPPTPVPSNVPTLHPSIAIGATIEKEAREILMEALVAGQIVHNLHSAKWHSMTAQQGNTWKRIDHTPSVLR